MHRIEKLLAELTLEEKVAMCAGSGPWHSTGVARLGIPPMKLSDGPNGVRGDASGGASAACFPVGSALAASWNGELMQRVGAALGQEAKTKGAQVVLGPTVNIHRSPLGGRHFECYSEDPYLSGRMAVAFVRGVQSQSVAATIKHFVCNDSEFERFTISSQVGERALREIYLPPFEAAVTKADAWALMSAYNRINGVFASDHRPLLSEILKREWGFRGIVMTDWGAAADPVEGANAGLDLEMPGPARAMGDKLLAAIRAGHVSEETVDDKVRRLLRVTILTGRMDDPNEKQERSVDAPEHRALARRAAGESAVLIRNEGVLPLRPERIGTLAVIGPNAETGTIQGGGSSIVNPHYQVHPLAAIRERLGDGVGLRHEPGCRIPKHVRPIDPQSLQPGGGEDGPGLRLEYWNGLEFAGEPAQTRVVKLCQAFWLGRFSDAVDPTCFCARYTGLFTPSRSGPHEFGLLSAGLSRLFVNEQLLIDNWTSQEPGQSFFGHGSGERRAAARLVAGEAVALRVEYRRGPATTSAGIQFGVLPPEPGDLMARAVEAASWADAAVVVVGTNGEWESEGSDRADMRLPGRQNELVERVAAVNPNTVVVLNAGSPVELEWLDRVPALLQVWFPGQEFGHALADLLFGETNPSGKLPTTWPMRLEDTPAFTNYPGENGRVDYGEGIFVGYRWYDTRRIEPRVPFGHGLSYTSFAYGDLSLPEQVRAGEPVELSLDVTNTGEVPGQEVVQLYLRDPQSRLARPEKELAGFEKIELAAGETRAVRFTLDERALSYWDPALPGWVAEPGEFEALVGSSSRDIRSRASFRLE